MMNDLKADGTPFYYAVFKISDKTLQSVTKKDENNGTTLDNSQNAHTVNPDGSVTFIFSSIVRGTKEQLLQTFEQYGITNPDNIEIPD